MNFRIRTNRKTICDDVINAKQFMGVNNPAYYGHRIGDPIVNLSEWDLPISELNYQRIARNANRDPTNLKYRYRYVRVGVGFGLMMKNIQCVNTPKIKWFLTYNSFDKNMYLLEPGRNKVHSKLRITGLFEPSAKIENRDFEYFSSQFQTSTSRIR